MEASFIFERIEKKYLLTEGQFKHLFDRIGSHLTPDQYGRSTVISLYLDTPDYRLIRSSIEAVDYKEKIRLRSYGTAKADSTVFLELKKKYGGVVYKRREAMKCSEAERYLFEGIKPFESQIFSEIDWAMKLYRHPKPKMMIACEREAWYDEKHPDLRLTFDRNIRSRQTQLQLTKGSAGYSLLPRATVLLEIKTAGAMPLWLADALNEEKIYPGSFSKYGTAYTRFLESKIQSLSVIEGGIGNVVNF